jgi:hypothetical protein
MNITSQNINKENLISKMTTPSIFYILIGFIVFLTIVMFFILFDVNITSLGSSSKSQQEIVGKIFIILTFSLVVVSICISFLPNMKEFKALFEQINNVSYVVLYTIFSILFYTTVPENILNN